MNKWDKYQISKVSIVTHWIDHDEKAMGLYEMNEQSPNSEGFHRYQIIHVIRDGKVAEYRKDMGKVTDIDSIRIPSLLEHTVGELMDMANWMRNNVLDKRERVQTDTIVG